MREGEGEGEGEREREEEGERGREGGGGRGNVYMPFTLHTQVSYIQHAYMYIYPFTARNS